MNKASRKVIRVYKLDFIMQSNSNWTFIALNLPYSKGILKHNKTKTANQFQYPGTEKSPSTTENTRGK